MADADSKNADAEQGTATSDAERGPAHRSGERKRRWHKRRRGRKRPASAAPKARKSGDRTRSAKGARKRTIASGVAGLGGVLILFGLGLFAFAHWHGSESQRLVELDWPASGLGPEQAAELLASAGLVRSASAAALYFRAAGGTASFVPGPHCLSAGASPSELFAALSRAPDRPVGKVVIPEGAHRFDIAARLAKQRVSCERAFLRATEDPALLTEIGVGGEGAGPPESAEGYLFPATYELPIDTLPADVVRRLVGESNKRWSQIAAEHAGKLAQLSADRGWGRREILTLASVIEEEAVMDDERPLIASVFMNRLTDPDFKPRGRLQSDPTAMYGCVAHPEEAPTCADYKGKATSAIVHDAKNRYSTYMRAGLPPGPISSPSEASIRAVLAPAETRYFYFVAKGGGRHTFSETFEAHKRAIGH